MSGSVESDWVKELAELLDDLVKLHERLLITVRGKIGAMKRADVQAMTEFSAQEQAIVRRIHESERVRCRLLGRVGKKRTMPSNASRSLSLSQLAAGIPESSRRVISEAADRLRKTMSQVAQVNRLAGSISREVLIHLRWALGSARPETQPPLGYAGDGELVVPSGTQIFETIG